MPRAILDSEALVLFVVGLIDPRRIGTHKKTTLYTVDDFEYLRAILQNASQIVVTPNIITEVDNHLNKEAETSKYSYVREIRKFLGASFEVHEESKEVAADWLMELVGISDTAILRMATKDDYIISGDSTLCDIARSRSLNIIDLKDRANRRLYL